MKGLAAQFSSLYTLIPLPHVCTQARSCWHCEHEGTHEISQVHATAILAAWKWKWNGCILLYKNGYKQKMLRQHELFYFIFFFSREGGIRFRCVWHFSAVFYMVSQSITNFNFFGCSDHTLLNLVLFPATVCHSCIQYTTWRWNRRIQCDVIVTTEFLNSQY